MGPTLGRIQETTPKIIVEPKLCSLCLSKYQRERQCAYTCLHCSRSFCSECANYHTDEQPQNVTQLSHQLHELEQLFEIKQKMVEEEVLKSTDEFKQWFKTYQSDLLEAYEAISDGIKHTKVDAEEDLNKIYSEMQTIKSDIETLAGETIFQPKRMEALLIQLNGIQEQLKTYKMTKTAELQILVPKYILKFQCIPASTTDTIELSEFDPSNLQDSTGKQSSRRNGFHPYRKKQGNIRKKISCLKTVKEIVTELFKFYLFVFDE